MSITHLYADHRIADHPMVDRFARLLGLPPIVLNDPAVLYKSLKAAADPWHSAKQVLLLTRNQGPFLKQCPGTRDYLCCDYKILHIGTYCTMDCAYCILQGYFHPPVLQYFVNQEDCLAELKTATAQSHGMRIGTGEFTDSLIWEAWADLTPQLVDLFSRQDRSVLELKTKTTAIENLKGLNHRRRTILAWSLNTPHIIATQERGTASLKARLRAAGQCQAWGYPLAFHFDPIIEYPGCEEDYHQVIQSLFEHVAPENIVWISLGTLRFMPSLRSIIQQRFPQSHIAYGEFITGLDGKMRYFKPVRMRLYRRLNEWIKASAPQCTVYLCMEDEVVWMNSLGFSPQSGGGLAAMLDRSAQSICGLRG